MYIVDAVVWLAKLMLADNGVYNVGSEKEISIRKLAQQVASFRIPQGEVIESDKEFVQNANYYVPDCTKAHELGLEQHFSLNYGIERMME
jgi:nucleoside-diphosphate-sugar epimerase